MIALCYPVFAETVRLSSDSLKPGKTLELSESRFEEGGSQFVVEQSFEFTGHDNKAAVITFDERPYDEKTAVIKPVDISGDTLVYLGENTEVVSYMPKEYMEESFPTEVNEHIFKGFPYYGLLFVLAAVAAASN